MVTNIVRAETARVGAIHYCWAKQNSKFRPEFDEDYIDLIADLLHLAAKNGHNPETIIGTAFNHFNEEHSP